MTACTIIKRDALGQDELSYQGLVRETCQAYVCIEAEFAFGDRDLGYVLLRRGDIFREWFFRDRWFNIFRVGDGRNKQLKGWYCNITRPPQFGPDWIAADDLCLDVFVYPDGRTLVLDEEEFVTLDLSEKERRTARKAVQEILDMVRSRLAPFDEIPVGKEKPN